MNNKPSVLHDAFSALVVQDARVFKAGNSLAVRIPSAIAKNCGLVDGASVQVAADDAMIYVRMAPSLELAALIEGITPENVHGPAFEALVDRERW
jgi:antitoxin MazE